MSSGSVVQLISSTGKQVINRTLCALEAGEEEINDSTDEHAVDGGNTELKPRAERQIAEARED